MTFSPSVHKRRQRGNAALETALIFLPMMLTIFGTFEVGRGMWMYHTLASAVETGARVAAVHGAGYATVNSSCSNTVSSIANVVRNWGIGLDASQLQLTLTADGASYVCSSLSTCLSDSTEWPPDTHNVAGVPLTIQATYRFQSILNSLWPGESSASVNFVAASTETIQF